ncbi:MAG: sulfotransferase [Hyphomonadaceae bacterium]|nr:sulfotransferase [Hyphomonadaceae bacterium]
MASTTQPLFIIGAPRSGNTLTRRVLMASGQIYIPPETYVFGEILSRWPKWRFLSWRERVWLACAFIDRHPHREDFEIESLTPFANALEFAPKGKQTLHHFYDELYAFMAREHGFTEARWGDKTPWNTVYLKDIVKAYPDAYYLYLKRDGLDVVASQVKADMRNIRDSGQRWIDANMSCMKHLKRARRAPLTIAYEDLVREPETIFRTIFDWADMDFAPEHLTRVPEKLADVGRHAHHAAVTKPITPDSIGRGRKSLTAEQLAELPDGFDAMMTSLGYSSDELPQAAQ